MKLSDFSELYKETAKIIQAHAPEILTGIGIVGMASAGIMGVRNTPKALALIDEARAEKEYEAMLHTGIKDVDEALEVMDLRLTPFDYIKATWKVYLPPLLLGVASAGCLVGATSLSLRRNASLAAAYSVAATTLDSYKDKIHLLGGPSKSDEVQAEVAKETYSKQPDTENITETGHGDDLMYDPLTGAIFRSSIEAVRRAINDANYEMTQFGNDQVSMNSVYEYMCLPTFGLGDYIHWNAEIGKVDATFGAFVNENGEPVITVNWTNHPVFEYFA